MKRKNSRSVGISKANYETIRGLAYAERRTMSSIADEAVSYWLKKKEKALDNPGQLVKVPTFIQQHDNRIPAWLCVIAIELLVLIILIGLEAGGGG